MEDSTPMRVLLSQALTGADFVVSATASSAQAIRLFGQFDPDVLIADIDLGERPNGVELATILRAEAPYLGIVFLTNYSSTRAFERTIAPPPRYAFLQKDLLDSTDRLIEVVGSALDDASIPRVIAESPEGNPLGRLTTLQLEVVRMIAMGLTNAQIAEARGSTQRAVERLVARTFEVLGLVDEPHRNPRVLTANLYTRTFGYPAEGARS